MNRLTETRFISPEFCQELCFICTLFLLISLCFPARADLLPVNGAEVANNIAEIYIEDDGIRIDLEIFVDDLALFGDLLPDEWFDHETVVRPDELSRLARFSYSGLSIRRQGGDVLPVEIALIEPRFRVDRTNDLSGKTDPITGRVYPSAPEDKRVVFVELFYSFEGIKPASISISPPSNQDGIASVSIGMIVDDRGVPVINFRYLSGDAWLEIDWDDPWYSRFDDPNLTRHLTKATNTYLYIEPREVRHETLIRVRDLARWLDLDLQTGQTIGSEDLARIARHAASFLSERNPVSIDQLRVSPERQQATLLELKPTGLVLVEDGAAIKSDAAFVGVTLGFQVEQLPGTVVVDWDMFDGRTASIPAIITDPAGPFYSAATPEDASIVWTNHLRAFEEPEIMSVSRKGAGAVSFSGLAIVTAGSALVFTLGAVTFSGGRRLFCVAAAVIALIATPLAAFQQIFVLRVPFSATIDGQDATLAVEVLLENTVVAQLEATSHDRRLSLKPFVVPGSLVDVSQEIERALTVRTPTGGTARLKEVENVRLENVVPLPSRTGFSGLVSWSAIVEARHWGHQHRQKLRYRAHLEVIEHSGQWRLNAITVVEAKKSDA